MTTRHRSKPPTKFPILFVVWQEPLEQSCWPRFSCSKNHLNPSLFSKEPYF
ncbi:S9 family peptidase [Sesbania bispinosa]|nr:S9 family peptidase [Sesbania bispinosa]